MTTLILMRHAKSDWSAGVSDHARPLNPRGRRAAAAMGAWLRDHGPLPDTALVSDAARTRETWARMALEGVKAEFRADLYHASPETMLDVLQAASAAVVLMLGHNPGLAEFAATMAGEAPPDPDFARYPTGAVAVIDFPKNGWDLGTGVVRAFVTPRGLGARSG